MRPRRRNPEMVPAESEVVPTKINVVPTEIEVVPREIHVHMYCEALPPENQLVPTKIKVVPRNHIYNSCVDSATVPAKTKVHKKTQN